METPFVLLGVEVFVMSRALSSSPISRVPSEKRWGLEVRVLWGDRILAEHFLHAGVDRVFRMGSAEGVDFAMSAHLFDQESFDVLLSKNGAFELHFTEKMPGALWRNGEAREFSAMANADEVREGVFGVELGWGDAACIEFGPLRFEVATRRAPAEVLVPLEEKLDFAFLSIALVMFLIGAGLVTTALTAGSDDDAYSDDLSESQQARVIKMLIEAPKLAQKSEVLKEHNAKKEKLAARDASKGKGGKLGAPNGPKVENKGNTHREIVAQITKDLLGKTTNAVFAEMDKSMKEAFGNVTGKQIGQAGGFLGGMGLKGDKDGGGGDNEWQTIGGIKRGKGTRVEGRPDYATGILCDKPPCKTVVDPIVDNEPPVITGSLDRELIRQVIHSHRDQIRYCYESELNRAPKLSGKVGVKFVINANGNVSLANVASTTMENATVETCIASRVRTWIFPKPKGGGQVIVQYPFVFKSSAQ